MGEPTTKIRPGEIVVDSAKTANLVHEHRRLTGALYALHQLVDAAQEASDEVARALDQAPEFDAIPPTALVDPSFGDWLPSCVICGAEVEWIDALLVPCSTNEDGDVEWIGVVHRLGCPESTGSGSKQGTEEN